MPTKGDRGQLTIRTPRPVDQRVRARARELGYSCVSDYVAAVLAVHEGMPELAPTPLAGKDQGGLFDQEGGERLTKSA